MSGFNTRAIVLIAAAGLCWADSLPEALQSKRYQDALAFADVLLARNPGDVKLLTARGIALGGLYHDRESIASFESALKVSPDFIPALRGAIEIGYRSRDSSTNRFLTRLLQVLPEDTVAHAMAGVLAFEAGDCELAIRHFEKGLTEISSNSQAYPLYGACLLKVQRAPEAVDVFQSILARNPHERKARFNLANAQFIAQRPADARETLQPLAALAVPEADVLNLMASAEAALDLPRLAIGHLRAAVQIAPNDERNYVDLAALYIRQSATDPAMQVVALGLSKLPLSARLHSLNGVLQAELGNATAAAAEFNTATGLDAAHEYGAAGLGVLYTETKQPELAIPMIRRRLRAAPHDFMLNFLLAQALMSEQGDGGASRFDEARKALLLSIAAKPEYTRAHTLLGKLYEQAGRNEQALAEFQVANKQDRKDRTALSHMALILRRLGRDEEAAATVAQLKQVLIEDRKIQ